MKNAWRHSIWPNIPRRVNDWSHLRHCSNSNLISAKNSWSNISRGSQLALTCLKEFLRTVWPYHLVSRFNSELKQWRPRTGDTAITNLWILNHSKAPVDFVVLRKKLWLTWSTTVPASELAKPEEYIKSKKDIPVGPYEILRRSDETSLSHIQDESLALFVDSLQIQGLLHCAMSSPWTNQGIRTSRWSWNTSGSLPIQKRNFAAKGPSAESKTKTAWKHPRIFCRTMSWISL